MTKSPAGKSSETSDAIFWSTLMSFAALYLLLILGMVFADLQYTRWADIQEALRNENFRFSMALSLVTCTISSILATWFAIPIGYLLARVNTASISRRFAIHPWRRRFALLGRNLIETLFDVPVVMPPLVVGLSLLVLFQTSGGQWIDVQFARLMSAIGFPGIQGITYEIPAIVLAQFVVATAFAIRIMRAAFEQIDQEPEAVALVMGATRSQAFTSVALPQVWKGVVNGITIAWAVSLGEFGPILIFAGTARMKTEVLSTNVFLNFSIGNLRAAVAGAIIMLTLAGAILVTTRLVTSMPERVSNESHD